MNHVALGLRALAVGALAAPMFALLAMRLNPGIDPLYMGFDVHFYVVGFTAAAAAIACAVIMGSARTLQNSRLFFLGLGFLAIAGIFSVHGLATPGYIVDEYYVSVSVSAWLSAALGSVLIALSVVPPPAALGHAIERHGKLLFAAAACAIGAYIVVSLSFDAWLDWVPMQERNLQLSLGLGALAFTGFAAWRYYQAFVFARLPSQLAMVTALALLMEVQALLLWGRLWHLSWWLYHAMYAVAFAVLFAGWAIETRRAGTLSAIADALSMRDALAALNRGLESPILELVDAIEIKDMQTLGHVRRVSGYALAIGQQLNLSQGDLRALVLAAEMHDVGKISIPNSLLAKPGPLTDEEFALIKTHTVRGHEIASKVAALEKLAGVIRHHHERYDGTGYPDAVAGDSIPLLSRIITVADSYDAMTSPRPYRDALDHGDAMARLREGKGKQFDPACVSAFEAVMTASGRERLAQQAAA